MENTFREKAIELAVLDAVEMGATQAQIIGLIGTEVFEKAVARYVKMFQEEFEESEAERAYFKAHPELNP